MPHDTGVRMRFPDMTQSSNNKSQVTHDIVSSVAGEQCAPHTGEDYLAIVNQIKD